MKQYNKKDLSDHIVSMGDMRPGDIGLILPGQGQEYDTEIVMKSTSIMYNDLVLSLSHMVHGNTWVGLDSAKMKVQLFKPGSVIRIAVK